MRESFGYSDLTIKRPVCLFVTVLCGRLLTGSGDISRHARQRTSAGAGHTLVSAQRPVGQSGDEKAAQAQHHAQIAV